MNASPDPLEPPRSSNDAIVHQRDDGRWEFVPTTTGNPVVFDTEAEALDFAGAL